MKWMVAALAMTLGGCVSVTELEQSHETLDVISGKSPRAYADCVKQKLADTGTRLWKSSVAMACG